MKNDNVKDIYVLIHRMEDRVGTPEVFRSLKEAEERMEEHYSGLLADCSENYIHMNDSDDTSAYIQYVDGSFDEYQIFKVEY